MNESILFNFTVGLLIGGMLGVMSMALLSARKHGDMSQEISDLRTQRKLLKEEIFRLGKRTKPNPRKRRPYNKKRK